MVKELFIYVDLLKKYEGNEDIKYVYIKESEAEEEDEEEGYVTEEEN